jgi:tRNA (guanosine-2'-O-)-methyltransferase
LQKVIKYQNLLDTELITYLSQFLSENRLQVFEDVLKMRTRYLTVVLEDLFQAQNASAVLRTCECFGIQDIHVIENRNKFIVHKDISMGSNKWLNIKKYNFQKNNTPEAINHLRSEGYRIIATSPDPIYPFMGELDISKGKMALFFGTELTGISKTIRDQADEFVRIPMYGFTESFNISVSVALCLQEIVGRIHDSELEWQLPPAEYSELLLTWIRYSIKKVDLIEKKYNTRIH